MCGYPKVRGLAGRLSLPGAREDWLIPVKLCPNIFKNIEQKIKIILVFDHLERVIGSTAGVMRRGDSPRPWGNLFFLFVGRDCKHFGLTFDWEYFGNNFKICWNFTYVRRKLNYITWVKFINLSLRSFRQDLTSMITQTTVIVQEKTTYTASDIMMTQYHGLQGIVCRVLTAMDTTISFNILKFENLQF